MDGNTNRAFFLWASAVAALMAMNFGAVEADVECTVCEGFINSGLMQFHCDPDEEDEWPLANTTRIAACVEVTKYMEPVTGTGDILEEHYRFRTEDVADILDLGSARSAVVESDPMLAALAVQMGVLNGGNRAARVDEDQDFLLEGCLEFDGITDQTVPPVTYHTYGSIYFCTSDNCNLSWGCKSGGSSSDDSGTSSPHAFGATAFAFAATASLALVSRGI